MRVLYIDWPCYGKENVIGSLKELGHEVCIFTHSDYNHTDSPSFLNSFKQFVGDTYFDFCFSFNYFPLVSQACLDYNMKYISVTYDSPYVFLYHPSIINSNNYAFVFDKHEYLTLRNGGISNIYYTPLPANTLTAPPAQLSASEKKRLSANVSFVGSLYNEKHNLYDRYFSNAPAYLKGYLEGIMNAQLKVHGYNFLEDVLTPGILADIEAIVPYNSIRSGAETPQYLYANYFLSRKLTAMEREQTLNAVANTVPLKLFTWQTNNTIASASNMGKVDYLKEMPYLFANSKINLNITLRSIKSGIPLRAMDIMGAGGFLLTNFQEDFLDYFIPGEDFVYYESEDDLLDKIHYLLSHEKERAEIAQNGYEKVKSQHNYLTFFNRIFDIVFFNKGPKKELP